MGLILAILGLNPLIERFGDAFWGAVFGYALFIPIAWVVGKLKGQQAMGNGDYKLMAALGAWLGWQALLPIVLMSSISGSVIGIGLMLASKLRSYGNQAGEGGLYMPFGPFLVLAGGLVYILGWRNILSPVGLAEGFDASAYSPHRPDRWHRQRQKHSGQYIARFGRGGGGC